MNYNDAIEYIEDQDLDVVSNIDKFRGFMDFLGNPQDDLKIIHIAGTNGKGSTLNYLSHVLVEAGYKTGFFVSPYIDKFNERLTLNNKPISDEKLASYTDFIKQKNNEYFDGKGSLNFFEKVTAIGFQYFKDEDVDFVLLETGIGGRSDSTNIVNSIAQIIATIEIDHTELLGDTIEEIADQKSDIIKDDSLVFSMRHTDSVDKIIENKAEEHNSIVYFSDLLNIDNIRFSEDNTTFDLVYKNYDYEDLVIGILGRHQIDNVSLAIIAALELNDHKIIKIDEKSLRNGLKKAKWPGRLEKLSDKPRFFIDGAHNIEGIQMIKESLDDYEYDRLIVGLNIMVDKEVEGIIKEVEEVADIVILTQLDFDRSTKAEVLEDYFTKDQKTYKTTNVKDAISLSVELAEDNDLIIFLGSLYLTGELRSILKEAII